MEREVSSSLEVSHSLGSELRYAAISCWLRGGWLPRGPARTNAVPVCPPRCKFFSLTETPEDYTIIVDEEGFLGESCSHWELGGAVPCSQPSLPPP